MRKRMPVRMLWGYRRLTRGSHRPWERPGSFRHGIFLFFNDFIVFQGSSWLLILSGLPLNIYVHICTYTYNDFIFYIVSSRHLTNGCIYSFRYSNFLKADIYIRFSTFSSKWRFWRAMPGGPHVGGLPPRWAHSCFEKNKRYSLQNIYTLIGIRPAA